MILRYAAPRAPTPLHLVLLTVLAGAGCSLVLNFDEANLPCQGDNQACAGSYSCLNHNCILDGSLEVDAACVRDRQCKDGMLCPGGHCARECALDKAFTASTCAAGHYCAPFVSSAGYTGDPNKAPKPEVVGVCISGSGCSSGSSCNTQGGDTCTVITGTGNAVNACLVGCSVTVNTDGTSTNNCGRQAGYERYCTPVGNYNYGQLACVTTGAAGLNPVGEGEPCNAASAPCNPALGCLGGVCRRYCVPTSAQSVTCKANEQCCSYALAATRGDQPQAPTGFCAPGTFSCPQ